jgi:HprK-related kinase A
MVVSTCNEVRVPLGDIAVTLRTDVDGLAADFADLYAGHRSQTDEPAAQVDVEVSAQRRALWGPATYTVHSGQQAIFTHRRRAELLPYLEWGINRRVIAACPGYLQLHAASLARTGSGVVLAGNSGAGKSTLAAGLMARGWRYLCDEFALIDPATLGLLPFPRALCVKSGAFEDIRRLGLSLWREPVEIPALRRRVAYIRPLGVNVPWTACPVPVRRIILLEYSGRKQPRLRPTTRAHAAFALSASVLNRAAHRDEMARLVGDLARGADCYILESGLLGPTCDLLETLV